MIVENETKTAFLVLSLQRKSNKHKLCIVDLPWRVLRTWRKTSTCSLIQWIHNWYSQIIRWINTFDALRYQITETLTMLIEFWFWFIDLFEVIDFTFSVGFSYFELHCWCIQRTLVQCSRRIDRTANCRCLAFCDAFFVTIHGTFATLNTIF